MDPNETLISRFYAAFAALDHKTMNECYRDDVVFYDPVFNLLNGNEVFAMWEMLCTRAKEFELQFGNIIKLDHEYYTCEWICKYRFSKSGRMVINKVKAFMRLADGKIIEHSDGFSVHKWSMQALGFSGWLLGWNRFYQKQISKKAINELSRFMAAR